MRRADITIYPRKSDFTLQCKCGTITTYGSSFKEEWDEEVTFECRYCGTKYTATIRTSCKEGMK